MSYRGSLISDKGYSPCSWINNYFLHWGPMCWCLSTLWSDCSECFTYTQTHQFWQPLFLSVAWWYSVLEDMKVLTTMCFRSWALSLTGGNMASGFDLNKLWSGFFVRIILTDAGMEHVSDVRRIRIVVVTECMCLSFSGLKCLRITARLQMHRPVHTQIHTSPNTRTHTPLPPPPPHSYAHRHASTYTPHTHTHSYTPTCTPRKFPPTPTPTHTPPHAHTHILPTHTHIHTHPDTPLHSHTHSYTPPHSPTHSQHTHMYTPTYMHAHIYTYPHTHIHTQAPPPPHTHTHMHPGHG